MSLQSKFFTLSVASVDREILAVKTIIKEKVCLLPMMRP